MRHYGGSALMLFITTAAAIGSYTINLKVSGERAAVERLRRQIVADARDMRNLQAELRTRARFPEMQRWNDNVLQMSAPSADQHLRSPVQLASFGSDPAGERPADAPAVRFTVTGPNTAPPPAATIVRAAYVRQPATIAPARVAAPASDAPATLMRASFRAPATASYAPPQPRYQASPSTRHQPPARATLATASLAADISASLDGVQATGAPRDLLPSTGN